jgi:hypothetical protein
MTTKLLDALRFARLPSGNRLPDTELARAHYLLLDAEAARIGAELDEEGIDVHRHHALALALDDPQRAAQHREIANGLALDMRLAALPTLTAWARGGRAGDISPTWVEWYAALLRAHVEAAKAQPERKLIPFRQEFPIERRAITACPEVAAAAE